MKLIWTRQAAADRRAIRNYIAKDNPVAALSLDELSLDELFTEKTARLLDHPRLGRSGKATGTLELITHRHYNVVYAVLGDEVIILRVLHTSRQWPAQE